MKDHEMIELSVFNDMSTKQLLMLISEEESLKMDGITLLYILEILNIRGMLIEPPVEVEQALEQLHKLYIAQEDLKE